MKAREGDLVETSEGLIFDVKGLVHPSDRIIAFVRYFPDEKGERRKDAAAYSKVYSLSKRYKLLRERFPKYLVYEPIFDEMLCEVPTIALKKHYEPVERLQELRSSQGLDVLEKKALQLAESLKENANIPWKAIGISGSILIGLHTMNSDVDPVVYGSENCRKAHSALKNLLKDRKRPHRSYDREDLKGLFDFRSKDTASDFESFVRTESRKVMQGRFMGSDYFVRFVKDWDEVDEKYGDIQYRNAGYSKIKATVVDDSQSIFTPCKYCVEDLTVIEGDKIQSIVEIASFRGRFCEQAKTSEVVIAQGKVEQVIDKKHGREYFRLLLGNKPSDFMILA
jgi:uncharacterized protein